MSRSAKELLKKLAGIGSAGRYLIDRPQHSKKAPAQQRVLDILAEEDGLTQGILMEILDVRPSSLAEVLKKLERRGDIERREDERDKRIKQVFITEAGKSKTGSASTEKDFSEEFFLGLSDEEQKQLDQLLNKTVAGWRTDFRASMNVPHDPFAVLEAMQKYRQQFAKEFQGRDFEDLTAQELHQKREEMREEMRREFGFADHHGRGHRERGDFNSRGNSQFKGFSRDSFPGFGGFNPRDFDSRHDHFNGKDEE